jgi:tetratricopeptide (TPR) repeat protein
MKQVFSKAEIYFHRLSDKIIEGRARQWFELSKNYFANGALEDAFRCLIKTLSIKYNFSSAYSLMAEIMMPGENYLDILSRFHNYLKPQSYVEIGVDKGDSLALAQHPTVSIGIDPFPRIEKKIRSFAKIYPVPSDEFFEKYNLFTELQINNLSMAFIDGLHHSDQVLKDFINLERYADDKTVIIIHDCLPICKTVANRSNDTVFWTGDTWKLILFLIKYRPDLDINVVPAPPSGLSIITKCDSKSTLLIEKYDQFVSELQHQKLPYEYLYSLEGKMFMSLYKIVPNEWHEIVKLLPY